MSGKNALRWAAWAIVLLLLFFTGTNLWHLKHMEFFLVALTLSSALLTVFFRIIRDKK